MSYTEVDIAKRSLSLFGIAGSLRRITTGLDSTYRVKATDGRVFALRVSSGIPIRRFAIALADHSKVVQNLPG